MNPKKLLEQLALAKQAGTQHAAKNFFAPVPGSPAIEDKGSEMAEAGGDTDNGPSKPGALGDVPTNADATNMPKGADGAQLTPEQLQELLQLLKQHGGGADDAPQG